MSAEHDRSKAILVMCSGKHRYPSFSFAERVAARRRRSKDREPLQAYRCRFCLGFHIGTNVKIDMLKR